MPSSSRRIGADGFLYKTRITRRHPHVDRVPFMWDFGFLLCNEHQWATAGRVALSLKKAGLGGDVFVEDIWRRLMRIVPYELSASQRSAKSSAERSPEEKMKDRRDRGQLIADQEGPNVSWREFLEASVAVAEVERRRTGEKVLPFDLAMATPESFGCWALEVWFSEIVGDALAMVDYAKGSSRRPPALPQMNDRRGGHRSGPSACSRGWKRSPSPNTSIPPAKIVHICSRICAGTRRRARFSGSSPS